MSNFLKNGNRLAAAPLIVVSGLGLTACNEGISLTDEDIVPGTTAISICDGANLRSRPNTGDKYDSTLLKTVDFGDAPDGTCVDIPTDASIYHVYEEANGVWYGVPETVITDSLGLEGVEGTPSKTGPDNTTKIIWINGQKILIMQGEGAEKHAPRNITTG
ncbi:MAG TPA: hypothetical protein PKD19_02385 [Candidatus Saccharibacteria bacterium]|nr:hypothetical protein [Candidatus Saccharibacteria bacterium]HMR38457.1 hypothetical protein [Candidatus Saccharibacteria bacterium]